MKLQYVGSWPGSFKDCDTYEVECCVIIGYNLDSISLVREFHVDKFSIIHRLEDNLRAKFSYIPFCLQSMDVFSREGICTIDSHLPCDMFNILLAERQGVCKDISSLLARFTKRQLPAAFWVGFEGESTEVEEQLIRLGYISDENELAMWSALDQKIELANPRVKIQAVNDEKMLRSFIQVLTELLPDDAKAIAQYYQQGAPLLLHKLSRFKMFVGYLDGQVVSTCSVFISQGVVGIFDVITLPKTRGQQVGTTMTQFAMKVGQQLGVEAATLTATNEAKYLYEKLGFTALKEMKVFSI